MKKSSCPGPGHEFFLSTEIGERSGFEPALELDSGEDTFGSGTGRYSGDIEPTDELSVSTGVGTRLGVEAPDERAVVSANSLRKVSNSRSNLYER